MIDQRLQERPLCEWTDASLTTLTVSDTPEGWSKASSTLTVSFTMNAYVCSWQCFPSETRKVQFNEMTVVQREVIALQNI